MDIEVWKNLFTPLRAQPQGIYRDVHRFETALAWLGGSKVRPNIIVVDSGHSLSTIPERFRHIKVYKRTLFIMTKHEMRIFGESPPFFFFNLQNNT